MPKSFVKVENWKVAEIPVCSCSNNSGFLIFFNKASSKLVKVMAVIVARRNLIFVRAGPRQHPLDNDETNSQTRYTVRSLELCSPVLRHFIICTHARRLSHDMHLATRDRHRVLCFTATGVLFFGKWINELIHAAGIITLSAPLYQGE